MNAFRVAIIYFSFLFHADSLIFCFVFTMHFDAYVPVSFFVVVANIAEKYRPININIFLFHFILVHGKNLNERTNKRTLHTHTQNGICVNMYRAEFHVF